jgi:phosphate transport system ATP-binding protein
MEREQKVAVYVEHVNAWHKKTQALYDINLTIAPLSVTALIGPSGCGKSTLLRCLNRMHEELPGASVAGLVQIEGINIYARSIKPMYVRLHIGMVFQQPNPLPTHSIWQNVAIGAQINGLAKGKALHERVERSLREASLWDEVKDRLHSSAITLSGGQQQRLCIARALAIEPKILLMDEPASALDPESTFKIEELIQKLKKKYTVVIVTHNMQQAARIADTTAFFLKGHVIEVGETQQLFARPEKQETERYVKGHFS